MLHPSQTSPSRRERRVYYTVQLGKEGQERWLRRERGMELCRWDGKWKLEGEDVASETEEAKAA
jgi:hypothetical protein